MGEEQLEMVTIIIEVFCYKREQRNEGVSRGTLEAKRDLRWEKLHHALYGGRNDPIEREILIQERIAEEMSWSSQEEIGLVYKVEELILELGSSIYSTRRQAEVVDG